MHKNISPLTCLSSKKIHITGNLAIKDLPKQKNPLKSSSKNKSMPINQIMKEIDTLKK